jgi:hypothetical protein
VVRGIAQIILCYNKKADGLGRSLAVKSSSTSKLISVSEVAKDTYTKYSTYGSQETPPIIEQSMLW